jgi:hypothetical protein
LALAGVVVLFLFVHAQPVEARQIRVGQIPNGDVFECATCHTSNFGGPRNDFGKAVATRLTELYGSASSTKAFWDSVLAGRDADGDGASNGLELGDPDGDGVPASGAEVTKPGDASSKPELPPAAPSLTVQKVGGTVQIVYPTENAWTYQLQSSTNLVPASWSNEGPSKPGNGQKQTNVITPDLIPQRCYRVEVK